jgi:hypothetical protein
MAVNITFLWYKRNGVVFIKHLITAFGGASPQGEAFFKNLQFRYSLFRFNVIEWVYRKIFPKGVLINVKY